MLADIAPEYDFRGAVRNPYAARYRTNAVVVTLDPDVAAVFPTTAAVNTALRSLVRAGKSKTRRTTTR